MPMMLLLKLTLAPVLVAAATLLTQNGVRGSAAF